MKTLTLAPIETERYESRITKTATCWLWSGIVDDKGYGRFNIRVEGVRKLKYAHRIAFETNHGDVPDGLKVDHACHNRLCVNPSHLRLLTHKQNLEHRTGPNKNSGSGVRGVYWSKSEQRWRACVGHNGKKYEVGRFSTKEEAAAAVIEMRNRLHTHNQADRQSV